MNLKIRHFALAGALAMAFSCSDESTTNQATDFLPGTSEFNPDQPATVRCILSDNISCAFMELADADAKWIPTATAEYLFFENNFAFNALTGEYVGNYDPDQKAIVGLDNVTILADNVVKGNLPTIHANCNFTPASGDEVSAQPIEDPTSSATATPVTGKSSAAVTPNNSSASNTPKSSATDTPAAKSSSSTAKSSSSQPSTPTSCPDGECLDNISKSCVKPWAQGLKTSKGSQYSYNDNCELQSWYDAGDLKDGSATAVGGATPAPNSSSSVKSSSSTAKSSSSTAKSSSSTAKSSSSTAKSSSSTAPVTSGCPNIVKKGGSNGSGWATRYWDCCMPSCSWPENAGGKVAKTCGTDGKSTTSNGAGSVCSGGSGGTCFGQVPFTVDGCTEYGFAFAAVPAANGGQCGKCFQLTFTGKGKYETKANHKALAGKKLIIMVSNIGGDVNQGQFDIMIPGGGNGAFNGCQRMNVATPGATYGGILSECEESVGYSGDLLSKRKECLTSKCKQHYSGELQQGCLFLADFMEAAGNPEHNYEEVECPSVLSSRY